MDTSGFHNRSPLRVLIIIPIPPPSGGIGRQAVIFLDWLKTKPGYTVRVVDISPHWREVVDKQLWKRIVGGGIQGVRDASRTFLKLFFFRPHVLHLHTSAGLRGPWDTGILAVAALSGVPSLYSIHMGRLPEIMERKGWEWWGLRWALMLADQVLVMDRGSERALKQFLPAERVKYQPNAINVPPMEHNSLPPEPLNVLYLGHVIPTKGMKELMQAWRELRPIGWRLRLAGLGAAAYQQELLGIVGAEAGVEFLGDLTPEMAWKCMQSATIFVLPSYTEGFPNVILEAMAAGRPIISTRVGAIPEMLDEDEPEACGLVIMPRDSGAIVAALRDLMAAPQWREDLGKRAREKIKWSYTTDIVFGQMVALWGEVSKRGK